MEKIQKVSLLPKISSRLIGGIKLSRVVQLSEKEFNQIINEIESEQIFLKMKEYKLIKYKRFFNTRFVIELDENMFSERPSYNIEPILKLNPDVVKIIKKVGIENFTKYILYNEDNLSSVEIAKICKISLIEIEKIYNLLNEIFVYSEFYGSHIDTPLQKMYYKIAIIEKSDKDDFIINFLSLNLARGKYEIDYNKIEELKKQGVFSKQEIRKMDTVLRQLELINFRKNVIYQIIKKLTSYQKEFTNSGEPEKRKLLTQKEVAKEVGVHPSTVSRIVKYKIVEIPTGENVQLDKFFCSKKEIKKLLVKKVVSQYKYPLTADKIKQIIFTRYGENISRRSVAYYLKELKSEL